MTRNTKKEGPALANSKSKLTESIEGLVELVDDFLALSISLLLLQRAQHKQIDRLNGMFAHSSSASSDV
jgi:hypothetical protein